MTTQPVLSVERVRVRDTASTGVVSEICQFKVCPFSLTWRSAEGVAANLGANRKSLWSDCRAWRLRMREFRSASLGSFASSAMPLVGDRRSDWQDGLA